MNIRTISAEKIFLPRFGVHIHAVVLGACAGCVARLTLLVSALAAWTNVSTGEIFNQKVRCTGSLQCSSLNVAH